MTERLQKIISAHGVASRRAAEKLIEEGRVCVNGFVAVLGQSADAENDIITIDGVPLRSADDHVYIVLNKPRGYVTTASDEKGRKTVLELVEDCGVRVYPVGRLDIGSEGLLILTNDGDFANHLSHPSGGKSKKYRVAVKGDAEGALEALNGPMEIDGYKIRPVKVKILGKKDDQTLLEFILTEGRNRQIRKMCAACELTVMRLVRVEYGCVRLGDLKLGKWRHLTKDELAGLYPQK